MPELQSTSAAFTARVWEHLAEHPEDAEAWERAERRGFRAGAMVGLSAAPFIGVKARVAL